MSSLEVSAFFDENTHTVSYIVADTQSKECAVIDSVLDLDIKSGRTSTGSAEKVISLIQEKGYKLIYILETHIHADHLTAAPYIKSKLGGETFISENVRQVQKNFTRIYNVKDVSCEGKEFNRLLKEGDTLPLGGSSFKILETPGHTPACLTFVIENNAFVGDTLFMPDFGTARCDFPGGSAKTLYKSLMKILSLPEETILWMCHDYAPGGREVKWETSVKEQKEKNIHIAGKSEEEFIEMRETRDKQLPMPVLLLPSIQVNMRGGNFPPEEDNGISYLKIPLDAL